MKKVEQLTLTRDDMGFALKDLVCEYESQTRVFAQNNVESVVVEMVTREAEFTCGEVAQEVSELIFKVRLKEESLFQPHNGTLQEFGLAAYKSLVNSEINSCVIMTLENPDA